MSWQNKLTEWQTHRLIDDATYAAIHRYEAQQPRKADMMWRYGLTGLAVLCISLGLIFMIAANWQAIPFAAKMAVHILINLGLGAFIVRQAYKIPTSKWSREIPLLLLCGAQLSLMALIGQYLNIGSPIEDVMLYWLILIAPMLVLGGQALPSIALLVGLSVYALVTQIDLDYKMMFIPLIATLSTFYLSSFIPRFITARPAWTTTLRRTGFYGVMVMVFILLIDPSAFNHEEFRYFWTWQIVWQCLAAAATAIILSYLSYRSSLRQYLATHSDMTAMMIFHLGVLAFMQIDGLLIPHVPIYGTILFCAYFLGIGAIAKRFEATGMISFAIIAIGIRIFVYFASVFNNMLYNGIAMIVIGSLTLFALKKMTRHIARTKGDAA